MQKLSDKISTLLTTLENSVPEHGDSFQVSWGKNGYRHQVRVMGNLLFIERPYQKDAAVFLHVIDESYPAGEYTALQEPERVHSWYPVEFRREDGRIHTAVSLTREGGVAHYYPLGLAMLTLETEEFLRDLLWCNDHEPMVFHKM